jgi:hypothetical protein
MPTPPQATPDVQSWVDNIALSTLGQSDRAERHQAFPDSRPENDAMSISTSRRSLDHDLHQAQDYTSNTARDLVSRNTPESLHIPVSSTDLSRPRSWQANTAADRSGQLTPGALFNSSSLLQLETAGILPEAKLSLPSSCISSPDGGPMDTVMRSVPSSFAQLSRLQPVEPYSIPLPGEAELDDAQSSAGSCGSMISMGSASVVADSLEQLYHFCPIASFAVPLPGSTHAVSFDEDGVSVATAHVNLPRTRTQNYWRRTEHLRHFMPHLEGIFPHMGRHMYAGKVTCIDYLSDGNSPRIGDEINVNYMRSRSGRKTMARRLRELAVLEDSTVISRIILVEDLCPYSVKLLGSAFGLDPEFFAEHLNRSGYHGEDYTEPEASRWNTCHLEKDYVALTWCRPVYQNPLVTEWTRSPRQLLNKEEDRTDGTSSVTWRDAIFTAAGKRNRMAREHRLKVETNIFRQSWSLLARSADFDGQRRATDPKPLEDIRHKLVPTAWQERASFCCIQGDSSVPIGKDFVPPSRHY